jgi:4a-hydroxytetrahydrobiopterin dehydratase
MTSFDDLLSGPCPPCREGTPSLGPDRIAALAAALGHGWSVAEGRLTKAFRFPDFASALAYVNRVGAMSEQVGHHPDVTLGWGKVTLAIWTHVAGGLTETDFAWAARAEALRED